MNAEAVLLNCVEKRRDCMNQVPPFGPNKNPEGAHAMERKGLGAFPGHTVIQDYDAVPVGVPPRQHLGFTLSEIPSGDDWIYTPASHNPALPMLLQPASCRIVHFPLANLLGHALRNDQPAKQFLKRANLPDHSQCD